MAPPRRCAATNRAGNPCGRTPTPGGTVCPNHGGKNPQHMAKAQVRAELDKWGLGDTHGDPGEILLRLVTQSAQRVAKLSDRLQRLVDEHGGDLHAAMVGETLVLNDKGREVKVGEYIRGLAQLEAAERDRCATFAAKAIAAGLARRTVELAERQGHLIAQLLAAVLADPALALSAEQRRQVPDVARRHLELVAG